MPRRRSGDDGETATRILDSAEGLVQVRGFNGFSYADVATELSLTTASLHYHFPGKGELGRALIARYASRFGEALAAIDAGGEAAPAKLAAYARLYADVLRARRMCLCGMLAAEFQTLPGCCALEASSRALPPPPESPPPHAKSRALLSAVAPVAAMALRRLIRLVRTPFQ